jgi:hypothetical protein
MKPYTITENKIFSKQEVFKINKIDFDKVKYDGTKMTFAFIGCVFNDLVIENYEQIDFLGVSIYFYNCYIGRLDVENIKSDNISLVFGSSVISGRIESDNIKNVSLNNAIINNGLFILGEIQVFVTYTHENIFPKGWAKILKAARIKDIETLLKIEQRYSFENLKELTFSTNEVGKGRSGFVREHFRVPLQHRLRYQLSASQIGTINLSISLSYKRRVEQSKVKISSSSLRALSIDGEQNGSMSVENCQIQNLYFRDFSTKGDATIFNIRPQDKKSAGKVEIRQSNLDNTWFDNIDFNEYKPLSFFRTRFGKVRFSSCSFPSDYRGFEQFNALENIHYPEKKSDNYYKDQYEIFLSLKNALESNGNFYESQKLQAVSNEALKKVKDVSRWDRAILWINSQSNNHGLSIQRPLWYFFGCTILLYVLYLWTLGRMFNSYGFDASMIGYYFSFIDPTHRIDFLEDIKKSHSGSWAVSGALALDFSGKLISGFFIYQFVAAFRKYGKK